MIITVFSVIKIKSLSYIVVPYLATTLLIVGFFECNIDSDIFYAWVTQPLIPTLPKNSVIVMNNATFHKRHDIQRAIIDAGHLVEYLPAYSPDGFVE